jgi:hypothetical protein
VCLIEIVLPARKRHKVCPDGNCFFAKLVEFSDKCIIL